MQKGGQNGLRNHRIRGKIIGRWPLQYTLTWITSLLFELLTTDLGVQKFHTVQNFHTTCVQCEKIAHFANHCNTSTYHYVLQYTVKKLHS